MCDTSDKHIKRSKNFSEIEVGLLLDLVKSRKDILENKINNSVTQKEKEACWKELAVIFNQSSGKFERDWTVLRGKYVNLKKTCRKKFFEETINIHETEGAHSKPSSFTYIDMEMKTIQREPVERLSSIYLATDNKLHEPNSSIEKLDQIPVTMIEIPVEPAVHLDESTEEQTVPDSLNSVNNWTDKNITQSMTSEINPGTTKRPKRKFNNVNSVAEENNFRLASNNKELFQLQKNILKQQLQFAEEEHKLKILHMQEEHSMKMQLLEMEIKYKNIKYAD